MKWSLWQEEVCLVGFLFKWSELKNNLYKTQFILLLNHKIWLNSLLLRHVQINLIVIIYSQIAHLTCTDGVMLYVCLWLKLWRKGLTLVLRFYLKVWSNKLSFSALLSQLSSTLFNSYYIAFCTQSKQNECPQRSWCLSLIWSYLCLQQRHNYCEISPKADDDNILRLREWMSIFYGWLLKMSFRSELLGPPSTTLVSPLLILRLLFGILMLMLGVKMRT